MLQMVYKHWLNELCLTTLQEVYMYMHIYIGTDISTDIILTLSVQFNRKRQTL